MGIQGLLPLIKPICEQKHVTHLKNKRVGIDVYGWLHKGVFSCALQVCRALPTTAFIDYVMHRVRMLIHFKVVPVLVFDGADLPMKAATHAERKARRDDARAKADAAHAAGDMRRAMEWYQRACGVTSDMARLVIRECRKLNVEYVVAPYEADAQLAWMLSRNHIAAVITEDSDLLAYGAHTVFYKMTRAGEGDLFDRAKLPALDTVSLANFSHDMFIFMCVCAGCDFFKGVPGLGLRKAHPIVRRARTLPRLVHVLRGKYRVGPTFAADFTRAYLVFRHQTVFDMDAGATVSLTELDAVVRGSLPPGALDTRDDGSLDLAFLGKLHDPRTARRVATGEIHPRTLREYDEPLDIVSRTPTPLRRARNYDFGAPATPHPPTREQVEAARENAPQQAVRGFAVQPASQPASATQNTQGYTPAANLRQRLAASAGTAAFNPRQAALAYNRANATGRARNPRAVAPQSRAVWSKFRPASTVRESDTSAADAAGGGATDGPPEDSPSSTRSTRRATPFADKADTSSRENRAKPSCADRVDVSDRAPTPGSLESPIPVMLDLDEIEEDRHMSSPDRRQSTDKGDTSLRANRANPSPADRVDMSDRAVTPGSAETPIPVMLDLDEIEGDQHMTSPDRTQVAVDPMESPERVHEAGGSTVTTSTTRGNDVGSEVTPMKVDEIEKRLDDEAANEDYMMEKDDGCAFKQLYTNNLPSADRPQTGGASSHRVEALNRMVGKFARPERDERLKFVPRPKRPPSPSREAYNLFEEMDAELSRDAAQKDVQAVPTTPTTPAKPRQTGLSARSLGKKSAITDGDSAKHKKKNGQLLVSRFFASSENKSPAKPSSLKVRTPGLKRKRPSSSGAGTPNKHKATTLGTLDRFRRPASSRPASSKSAVRENVKR